MEIGHRTANAIGQLSKVLESRLPVNYGFGCGLGTRLDCLVLKPYYSMVTLEPITMVTGFLSHY